MAMRLGPSQYEYEGYEGTGEQTSISGNLSFKSLMERCAKPSGLNDSSAVSVFKCSGVCTKGKPGQDHALPDIIS